MARTLNKKPSFVGGLLSPHLMGRTDLAKYESGCETLNNFIVKLQGDLQRRPGFRYVADAAGPSRLVPFIFSLTQAYILEFGNQILRFFTNDGIILNGPNPYSIATPYNTATDDLWDLKFAQVGNIVYITHPNHPPMKLQRLADTNWRIIQPIFNAPPAIQTDQDVGTQKSANISISVTLGVATITASNKVFINGDIGKAVVAGTGVAFITALSGATSVDGTTGATLYPVATATVVDPYDLTSYNAGLWFLRGSPGAYFAQGAIVNISGNNYWVGSGVFGQNTSVGVRSLACEPVDLSYTQTVGASTAIIQFPPPLNTSGIASGLIDAFRTLDVNRYVSYSGGYGLITAVTNSTTATVYLTSPPTISIPTAWGVQEVAPASPGSWHLEDPAFSATLGYPRACVFFQDRLWFASTLNNPVDIWGSGVSAYEDFSPGQLAVDGVHFGMNNGDQEPVQWMAVFQGNIVAGTFLSETLINGGTGPNVTAPGAPITPTNINTVRQSKIGTDRIQAIQVDTDLIFIQRAKAKAFEFSFNLATSSFGARNLNILNDLIISTQGSSNQPGNPVTPNVGFKEMVYQHEPFQIIWFTTYDGLLFGLTYDKANDVWAWHAHPMNPDPLDITANDSYVSIATIPSQDTNNLFDELWAVVKRIRSGQVVYTVETQDVALYMDGATRTVFANPVTQITIPMVGANSYLRGRYIYVVADGALLPGSIMGQAGTYTFPAGFSAVDVQIGINFISEALTTRPEMGKTIQGVVKRWNKLIARVYQSLGLTVNQQFIPNRVSSNLLDKGVPLFTGDESIVNLGWDRDGRIDIKQIYPLPTDILSLFGQFEVGEN